MRSTLDTDTIIELLKGNEIIKMMYQDAILVGDEIYINAISYYEIRRGLLFADYKKRSEYFDKMCEECGLLLMDKISIFDKAAEIYAELKRRNKDNIGDCDILIASIACVENLSIITNNVSHFEFIKDFIPSLIIDNWIN